MKNIVLLALCALFLNSSVMANNVSSLLRDLYSIEDKIQENSRKINRRQKMADDIAAIIAQASADITERLRKRGGGRGGNGQVDMFLVQTAKSACSQLGYWNQRKQCFSSYFEDLAGFLGTVNKACGGISNDEQSSKCFQASVESLLKGELDYNKIAYEACQDVGYWNMRAACFRDFSSDSFEENIVVTKAACEAPTSDEQKSKCYANAFAYSFGSFLSIAGLLVESCGKVGYWNMRAACYKAGVQSSVTFGSRLDLYTKGCIGLNDQQASNCYTRVLEKL